MITIRRHRLRAGALLCVLLGATGAALPAEARRAPAPCASTREPALAARLSQDIAAALEGRGGTVSVAVHDPARGLRCRLDDTRSYDSASIAKVLIMQAVLGRAEELGRQPTALESRRMKAMITRSDNDAAGALWQGLSRARLARVLREAGAKDTVLGHDRYWGLTRTTARDQLALLAAVSRRPQALTLMGQVVRSQAWGVTAGAPRTVKVHLKNGWLPRSTHGWRVHSVGIARPAAPPPAGAAPATDYRMALLSHDNTTMAHGVRTLEGVAVAVHRRLSGTTAARGLTPASEISERPDGSAPYGLPVLRPGPLPVPDPERGPAPSPAPAAGPPPRTAAAPRRAPSPPRSRRSG
ncbi:hypothetical protein ACVW0K_001784 [Streptomyces filamentosus]